MARYGKAAAFGAATAFGAVCMVAQTLLLRRFLWRFEAAETAVSLFLSGWLLWSGLGAAVAACPVGRRVTALLERALWVPVALAAGLYFLQVELYAALRGWLGAAGYERLSLVRLAAACLAANAPFCFVSGFALPAVCRRLAAAGVAIGQAFAWEALGAALGGLGLTLLLTAGFAPDPRDEVEWRRFFPQAEGRPGRFETGGGTTLYGVSGGTFYALSSGGVSEVLPEGDRAFELAALALSQRPYARDVLLLGRVPLAVGMALEAFRPDLSVTWCPGDPAYGARVLEAVRAAGLKTRVRAAGVTPQAALACGPAEAYDVVLVAPPSAAAFEGAAWRTSGFAAGVRRVTRRTGAALFGLEAAGVALTPEAAALLGATVRGVRHAWPEAGVFAAGAGGWWVAAQVPGLAYGAEEAAARFGLLKREGFPSEAVVRLYDPARGARFVETCAVLDAASAPEPPEEGEAAALQAAGVAAALRRADPGSAPGRWLSWLAGARGIRMVGLLLAALAMLPVAFGSREGGAGRLAAAWLAACGGLGLAGLLGVLYRLQVRFGSLYLLAGACGCLYLTGLYVGNRAVGVWAVRRDRRAGVLRLAATGVTLLQAVLVCVAARVAEQAEGALALVGLCGVLGLAAGGAVPVAVGLRGGGGVAAGGAVLVLADAFGAAAAGLAFAVLAPLCGLWAATACVAACACGVALCVAACGAGHARWAAGLALAVSLTALGRLVREGAAEIGLPSGGGVVAESADTREGAGTETPFAGVPRRLDVARVRELMRTGRLATNEAAYWE